MKKLSIQCRHLFARTRKKLAMSQTISLYPTIIRYGMYKFCQALTPLDQIRNDDVLCDVVAIRAKKLPIFLIILVSHFLQFLFSKSKVQRMYEMVIFATGFG